MIKKFKDKLNIKGEYHIEEYLKENRDRMALIALVAYSVLVTSSILTNIIYNQSIIWKTFIYHCVTLVFLILGMKSIIGDKNRDYLYLMIAFFLSTIRPFIAVQGPFYIGYLSLLFIIINIFVILTFIFEWRFFNITFYIFGSVLLLLYENMYFESNQTLKLLDVRIIGIYFLTTIFALTWLVKRNYRRMIHYISQLAYRDYETSFFNERQLIYDLESLKKNGQPFYLMAISFENLDYLYRKHSYDLVNQNYRRLLNRMNHQYINNFYRLNNALIAFVIENEKELEGIKKKLKFLFNEKSYFNNKKVDFKYHILGTMSTHDYSSIGELINHLFQVKYNFNRIKPSHLGHKISWYNEKTMVKNKRMAKLEEDIFKALNNNQFSIHIQPKISLNDPNKTSGEILARWKHPELGYISPYEFIPIIESKNLMETFTEQIIKKSHGFMKGYEKQLKGKPKIAVNISSSLFSDKCILKLMKKHVPMKDLSFFELEITEHVILEMNDYFKLILEELKGIGITLAIDDFGTGFSNFQYLQDLKIDTLKIDKKFIDGLNEQEHSKYIVKAMVDMGHALKMSVVAEGVEDKEQLDVLKDLRCDEIQGYYFSKPLTPEDFIRYYDK